jgi:leishmanolysin
MKIYNLIIIICIGCTVISKRCQVERVDRSKIGKVSLYTEEDKKTFRNLQGTTWQPIRMHVDYTHLDGQKSSKAISDDLYNNIRSIMELTATNYETLLLVNRSGNKLSIPGCNGLNINPTIIDEGIDGDIIIIPYVNVDAGANIEASASFCFTEETTGRPIAGGVGFGKSLDFSKTNSKYYYSLLTLHEMNHILSFHMDLFPDFIDSTTGQKYKDGVTISEMVNGVKKTMVSTPKVVAAARKHFGCPTMKGVETEDQGGDGTEGSHWEERVMLGDFMIGESFDEVVISEISLALMEDSGWYKVNYFTGGLFRYGKNQGCGFVQSKCVENGVTNFPNEFSIVQGQAMCFAGRTGKGMSSLRTTTAAIDPNFQYFKETREGGQLLADYCPVAGSLTTKGIWYGNHCNVGKSSYPAGLFETIGPNSYCFISSLTTKNDSYSLGSYKNTARAICHAITCDPATKTYTITLENSQAKCPKEGGIVTLPGFEGSIICSDYNRICTKTVQCSDTIDCITKNSSPLDTALDYTPSKIGQTIEGANTSSSIGGLDIPSLGDTIGGLLKSSAISDINLGAKSDGNCNSFFGLGCNAGYVRIHVLGILIMILFSLI